jgi:hypothetical protein
MAQRDDDFSEHELTGQGRTLTWKKKETNVSILRKGEETMYPKKSVHDTGNDFVTQILSLFIS